MYAFLLAQNNFLFSLTKVLVLLDGLDEVHGVGNLDSIRLPAGHPERLGQPGKGAISTVLQPLEFAQCLLTGIAINLYLIQWEKIFQY